jgi:hypothetical protein
MTAEMPDPIQDRVSVVEQKVDAFSKSVDRRFEQVDRRFEQVDRRFEQVDRRFDQVDQRFDQVDRRFDETTAAVVEQRQYTEFAFERLRGEMLARFDAIEARMATRADIDRLERKLDQFIDASSRGRDASRRPKRR